MTNSCGKSLRWKYLSLVLLVFNELYTSDTTANPMESRGCQVLMTFAAYWLQPWGINEKQVVERKLPGPLRAVKTISDLFEAKQRKLRETVLPGCEEVYRRVVHQTVALDFAYISSWKELGMLTVATGSKDHFQRPGSMGRSSLCA